MRDQRVIDPVTKTEAFGFSVPAEEPVLMTLSPGTYGPFFSSASSDILFGAC